MFTILDKRGLYCDFMMNDDSELIHEIFSQFNKTNNKFHEVVIVKSSSTNFVFDENTTGKLR